MDRGLAEWDLEHGVVSQTYSGAGESRMHTSQREEGEGYRVRVSGYAVFVSGGGEGGSNPLRLHTRDTSPEKMASGAREKKSLVLVVHSENQARSWKRVVLLDASCNASSITHITVYITLTWTPILIPNSPLPSLL